MLNIDSYNFSTELTVYLKMVLENYEKMNLRSDVKENLFRNNIESVKSIEEFIKLEGGESSLEKKIGKNPYKAFIEQDLNLLIPYYGWWIPTLDFTDYSEIFHIGKVPARWVSTNNVSNQDHVLFHLHGGGYVSGTIIIPNVIVNRISKASEIRVMTLNYGLGPKRGFPVGLNDSVEAYKWLLNQGFKPEKIIIFGGSAGGGLTFATLLKLRDLGLPLPKAGIGLSPWVDLTLNTESYESRRDTDAILTKEGLTDCVNMYLKNSGEDPKNPYVSPLYADLTDLPPILIEVGDSEVFIDENTKFAEKAKEAGVDVTIHIYPEMPHVHQRLDISIPEVQLSINNIVDFIKNQFGL